MDALSVDDIQKQARAAADVLNDQITSNAAAVATPTDAAGTDWADYATKDTFKKLKEDFEEAKKKLDRHIVKIERDYNSLLDLVDSEIKDATTKEETIQAIKGSMWNIKQVFEAKKLVGKEHNGDGQASQQHQQPHGGPGGAMGAPGQAPGGAAPPPAQAPGPADDGLDDDTMGGGGKGKGGGGGKGKGGGGHGGKRKGGSKKSSKKGKGRNKGKTSRTHRKNKKRSNRKGRKRG